MLFLLMASACVKDKPEDPNATKHLGEGRRLLIANEGSLGTGSSSLSVFFQEKDSIFNHVYELQNDQTLGDIFQSITQVGDQLFLAINNSDKIIIVDALDYTYKGEIAVNKPRNMLLVSPDKMYVSSLFHSYIYIINPKTLAITGQIATDYPNTEGLLLHNNKVYACNWDTSCSYLYEIDYQTDLITDRIPLLGKAPQQVLADKNGQLWVLGGNVEKQTAASLTKIDLSNGTISGYIFPEGADMLKPCFNGKKDTLFLIGVNYNGSTANNGVFRTAIQTSEFEMLQTPFIQAEAFQYFWALAVDSLSGNIYVGDPKGFVQKGALNIYNSSGQLIEKYSTGLGPAAFLMID